MPAYHWQDLESMLPDVSVEVIVDEGPGQGNGAPASVTFRLVDQAYPDGEQTVRIVGEWERSLTARALRWAADRLDGIPEYILGHHDISAFTTRWLREVQTIADSPAGGLAQLATTDTYGENAFYGQAFLMQHVGPRVVEGKGSDDELVLYAVLATYQQSGVVDGGSWPGFVAYVAEAFAYCEQLGERVVGEQLRARADTQREYFQNRRPHDSLISFLVSRSSRIDGDEQRFQEHNGNMAEILDRDYRAADLLAPPERM